MTILFKKTLFLTPVEHDEVQSIIKTLNLKKATGPSSIHTKLLKAFYKTISVVLGNLINLSSEKLVNFKFLKIASEIPIDCNN